MRWEIYTEDGIFLALRYEYPSAMRCARDFENRWSQGTTVVPVGWPRWSPARTIAAPRRTDQLLRHLNQLPGILTRYLDNHCANADAAGMSALCECRLCRDARAALPFRFGHALVTPSENPPKR